MIYINTHEICTKCYFYCTIKKEQLRVFVFLFRLICLCSKLNAISARVTTEVALKFLYCDILLKGIILGIPNCQCSFMIAAENVKCNKQGREKNT